MAAGPGTYSRAPGCGKPGARGAGMVSRLRPATLSPRGENDLPSAAQGTPFPRVRSPGVCGARRRPRRGAETVRGLRPTRRSPRLIAPSAPRGGLAAPRRFAAAPRGLAAPCGGLATPRGLARPALAYPHVPAPDVSGPRWPRPWERLLIPDQKARRQRTGRSYTPRELAPAQAAPLTPRPWKPVPRMSAGRQPPAPKAGAVNLRGLTGHP